MERELLEVGKVLQFFLQHTLLIRLGAKEDPTSRFVSALLPAAYACYARSACYLIS